MDSAREKLKRANLHLGSLSRFVRRFAAHDPYRIGFRVIREDDKRYATAFVDVWNPLPASIPLIAGDICNNLRLALDHLLRQCWLDAGPAFVGPGFAGPGFVKGSARRWAWSVGRSQNAPYSFIPPGPLWGGRSLDRIEISDQDLDFLVGKACIGHQSARLYRFRIL